MSPDASRVVQKCAVRRGARNWERWDNFAEEWIPLPQRYYTESEQAARAYAAGFYGVRPQQVGVET